MANGINKVILIGHLGQDPEIRHTGSGIAVANMSLATTEKWKDNNGEQHEKTEWHRLIAFRRTAEIAGEYLGKGSLIYVEGKLQTRKWEDDSGITRYTTEIVISNLQMLGSKQQGGTRTRDDAAQRQHHEQKRNGYQPQSGGFDEDIPF